MTLSTIFLFWATVLSQRKAVRGAHLLMILCLFEGLSWEEVTSALSHSSPQCCEMNYISYFSREAGYWPSFQSLPAIQHLQISTPPLEIPIGGGTSGITVNANVTQWLSARPPSTGFPALLKQSIFSPKPRTCFSCQYLSGIGGASEEAKSHYLCVIRKHPSRNSCCHHRKIGTFQHSVIGPVSNDSHFVTAPGQPFSHFQHSRWACGHC